MEEQEKYKFIGSGELSEDDQIRHKCGYEEGSKWADANFRLGVFIEPPYDIKSSKYMSPFWRGWHEGYINSVMNIIQRDYPHHKSITLKSDSGTLGDGSPMWYEIVYRDGRKERVDCYYP